MISRQAQRMHACLMNKTHALCYIFIGECFATMQGKVCIWCKWSIRPELISDFRSRWEYIFSPLNGMLVHRRITPPSIKFPGTHLYTWVERGTVRVKCVQRSLTSAGHTAQTPRWSKDKSIYETVKCLAQEHSTRSLAGQGWDPDHSIRRQARHKATVPTQTQSYNNVH